VSGGTARHGCRAGSLAAPEMQAVVSVPGMILQRRAVAAKAQDCSTAMLDVTIVVVGMFTGLQVVRQREMRESN